MGYYNIKDYMVRIYWKEKSVEDFHFKTLYETEQFFKDNWDAIQNIELFF